MSASKAALDAKVKEIQNKLWQKAYKTHRNLVVGSGEHFPEYYHDDNMFVTVYMNVTVYESEQEARRKKCTFIQKGKYGYVGAKTWRGQVRSR